MIDPYKTRGYLNNNPTNLVRMVNDKWPQEIRDPNDPRLTDFQRRELTQGRFSVFPSAEWGICYGVKNITYHWNHERKTVRAIISVWAPPVENNTAGYINRVCAKLGVGPDDALPAIDYKTAYALVDAIICVECVANPYLPKVMEDGLRLAGLIKPVGAATSNTVRGTIGTASGVAIQPIADQIQNVAYTLEPAAGASPTIGYIVTALKILGGLAILIGLGVVLYERYGRADRDKRIEDVPDTDAAPVPVGGP